MISLYKAKDMKKEDILTRGICFDPEIERTVDEILASVRTNGDQALYEYNRRFDHADLSSLEVSQEEMQKAYKAVASKFLETLKLARKNIEEFHRRQVRSQFVITDQPGVVLGQKITPIERVGLYVPGGTAAYPSTVLMNAVPAKLAGVQEVVMVTPPNEDGSIKPEVLATAQIAGISRVFKVGGAQAIAALCYGTKTIPRVDKITGPGNIYVATAKRRVYGMVDIDMIAGPSEILVIADETSKPAQVAADLLSQAEHDRMASAVLVTDSLKLAKEVQEELKKQLMTLPRSEIARTSMENNGKIILTDSIDEAVKISNQIAPEHLELSVQDPFRILGAVKNAGSIFLGTQVPEALGDYLAGPNHTLPTGGTARFSSPLSVDDFVKKSSFIYYTADALDKIGDHVIDFAKKEGLDGHARAISVRTKGELL